MPPYVGQYCCPISFLLSLQGKEEESERESTVQKVEDYDPYLMKKSAYFVISYKVIKYRKFNLCTIE